MPDKSKIEWTDATWNPVTGCTKVSPGCAHCYAETVDHRFDHDGVGRKSWALSAEQGGRGVTLHPDRLDQPLKWMRPRRVFVNSMSDLFHEDVGFGFIFRVFKVMRDAPMHEFQILTKRPQTMNGMVNLLHETGAFPIWPLPNVWLGVSTENQYWANKRIPLLMQTPAAKRFVSVEPMLKPVNLAPFLTPFARWFPTECPHGYDSCPICDACHNNVLDWVIIGGESGPNARYFDPNWARFSIGQCVAKDVPVFLKQLGTKWAKVAGVPRDQKGGKVEYWPRDLQHPAYRSFPQPYLF